VGSISGAFALIAFIGGLFCRRLKTALIVGAAPAVLYVALVIVGLWNVLPNTDLAYLLGSLVGACLVILLFACSDLTCGAASPGFSEARDSRDES